MTHMVGELHVTETSVGVPGSPSLAIASAPEALFHHTRTDDFGRYRPLSGAKTMPTSWRAELGPELSADSAIEAIYPLALVHQRQRREGTLRVVSLDEVLAHQSGRYESTSALSPRGRDLAIETVCGACVRRPVWNSSDCADDEIPCPEPCSVMVAFCREATLWEAERPSAAPVNTNTAWAAFDEPGNELRERFLQEMAKSDD